jgi:hypothetical protein
MKSYTFWDLCLPSAFTLVSFLAYSPTLKMEAICSFETSVDFQRTTRRYIPEDNALRNIFFDKVMFLLKARMRHGVVRKADC